MKYRSNATPAPIPFRPTLAFALALALAVLGACDSASTSPGDAAGSVDASAAPDGPTSDSTDASDGAATDSAADADANAGDTSAPKQLLAGAAAVDITPGAGVPLGGFGAAPRRIIDAATIPAHIALIFGSCYDPSPGTAASLFAPNTGKHDPIMARTLIIDNGAHKVAFVKLDAIGVSRRMHDDIAKHAKALGIAEADLVVSATHTHSGPAAVSEQTAFQLIAMDCLHQPTYDALLKGIRTSMTQANNKLVAAKVGIGATVEKTVSENRSDRPGVFDPQLGLLKVTRASDGAPIAALINFAIHGTCLGAKNLMFSADVMGYTERALEKTLGGGVAMFLNGAEGDVSPTKGGFDGAQQLGDVLAATTAKLWPQVSTKSWVSIDSTFSDTKMPKARLNGCLPLFGSTQSICDILGQISIPIDQWMQKVLPFAALRIDDVAFAMVPGEAITDIGKAIKSEGLKRGFRYTFVVGLANDYMGYITTKAEYNRGQYEAQSTLYGENTGAIVVSELAKRLDAVKAPAP